MQEKIRLVDELFRPWDTNRTPGCALAVVSRGEIIYKAGYGMATLEHPVTIKPSTAFYIASTSKQFAAFSIALLEEEGRLSASDDIRKYIPEIPDYGSPIRIEHLIHHISGMRDFLELNALSGRHYDELITPEDALRLITRQQQLNFDTGERYLYCNSGYFLLSVIIERVSGKTLRQFAEENIFARLGMHNTHFHDDRTEPVTNRAVGYRFDRSGRFRISVPGLETVGSGGMYSTVEDLSLWDRNFYMNRLGQGSPALIERIQHCGSLNNGELLDYAFGLSISEYKGLKTVGHSGNYGGYSAEFTRFPDHAFTVICLSNNSTLPARSMAFKVADIFLAEHLQEEPAEEKQQFAALELSVDQVKPYAGFYRDPQGELVIKISPRDNQLVLDLGQMEFPLIPSSIACFHLANAPIEGRIEFTPTESGMAAIFESATSKKQELLHKMASRELSAAETTNLCGEYYSTELDARAFIYHGDGCLRLKIGRHTAELNAVNTEEFVTEGDVLSHAILTVQREADALRGITLNSGRVRNIFFARKSNPER